MQSQYRDTIKWPRSLRNRRFVWINECFQFFFISLVFLQQKKKKKKTIQPEYHILLSPLTSNSFTEVSLVSVYYWHLSQSISHTQNFANLISKKSQIRSPWNCKCRLKASLFASQSQRKRTKIQKAGRNREITCVFEEKLKDSDSTVYHWSCHTCRFAIQRGRDMVARKYAFLSVHSPVRFGGEMLRESL